MFSWLNTTFFRSAIAFVSPVLYCCISPICNFFFYIYHLDVFEEKVMAVDNAPPLVRSCNSSSYFFLVPSPDYYYRFYWFYSYNLLLALGCHRHGRIVGNIPYPHTCLPCCLSDTRFHINNFFLSFFPAIFHPSNSAFHGFPLILFSLITFPWNIICLYVFLWIILLF